MSSTLEIEALRSAACRLALDLWPRTEASASEALDHLAAWGADPHTRSRFRVNSAESLLDRLGASGLLEIGDRISFSHRLFATLLASEEAADVGAVTVDDELAPFVAALLDDDSHVDLLVELLSGRSAFEIARFLRLSVPRSRAEEVSRRTLARFARHLPLGLRSRSLWTFCESREVVRDSGNAERFELQESGSADQYADLERASNQPIESGLRFHLLSTVRSLLPPFEP